MLGTYIDSTTDRDLFMRSVQATSSLSVQTSSSPLSIQASTSGSDKTDSQPSVQTHEITEQNTVAASLIDTDTELLIKNHLAAQIGPLANMLVNQAIQKSPDLISAIELLSEELPTDKQKLIFRKKFIDNTGKD